ncbi:Pleckstrin (PH) and lipid-binding START domains-containing protein [Theobroma cacao]|uniref:Pleckstrin (PH) and lipid-binding START domains-containing protein n=1 Tax=Theobroma cacao TaxID=3641 RepID=A0A061FN12_THECC|nr:Pleckstrin (PH) and lipid-binding START domains-containing protein [Theobroma cacao]
MEAKMEGWLYTIRSNRFGLQFSRKRYFILHNNVLKSYKAIPISDKEEPVRSAMIDSCIRVTDDGRESIHKKVFFIFTLHSTLDHNDQLKLGARSSEEAAIWIRCLKDAALKESRGQAKNFVAFPKKRWPSLRLGSAKTAQIKNFVDWPFRSSVHAEAMTSDVIAPSPWKIFGCQNGLRLFKEAKDGDSRGGHWDDHPAIMAVGVVDGTSETIFRAVMSLGPARSEWDFCLYRGSVVEHLDGHTDIIHKQLYSDWLPWGMKRRDLLLQRYWRREDDGTYVILYHSVFHKKCLPQSGYVRARLKSGGYVITPVNQGKQSLVKHMLAIDWRFWKLYLRPSAARSLTIRMLERVAALRELLKAKQGNYSSECLAGERRRDIDLHQIEREDFKMEIQSPKEIIKIEEDVLIENEVEKQASGRISLMSLNEAPDEFFDVPEASEFTDYDPLESEWPPEPSSELRPPNIQQPKLTSAAGLVRKLHDLAIQKKGYMDLQEVAREDSIMCSYGTSLQKDPTCTLPCSWSAGDPSAFLIRGKNYLKDHQKIKAKGTLMQMVGADWLISDKREDDLGSRLGGIVQKYAARGGPEFFFIVNMQIPGAPMYTLAMYYMIKTPLEDHPLLYNFVNGDDAYRNSRFKLIPYISKGSWIVKQSVGKKACLIGHSLEIHYFRGQNYLEVEVDVGSSTVARGVSNLVLGYLNNLVIELAFVIQGNTQEELPETLLGTCRLNRLDLSKAPLAMP